MRKALLISALAGGSLFGAQSASAHGDPLDGPVATPALQARDAQHGNLVLPNAPAEMETEIKEAAAFAQASGAAAEESTVNFDVPEGMKTEHDQLHADLAELTQAGGRTGEAAKAVAEVLEPHFVKENEYALPPLSLLVPPVPRQVRSRHGRSAENDGQARSRDADHAFRARGHRRSIERAKRSGHC